MRRRPAEPRHPTTCPDPVYGGPRRKGHDCPGDPLCSYTVLARIHRRASSWPAMLRLREVVGDPMHSDPQERWEILYRAVCAVELRAPADPVKGCWWHDDGYALDPTYEGEVD